MKPQHDASLDFLRAWSKDGPWVLTSISTDRKRIDTRTFHSSDEVALRSWLKEHADRNIYFHVNPALRDLDKKAEKEDIRSVDWLHIDIDPRVGEDLRAEQERILARLQKPPDGVPPPTCIIFSGGGLQGFWKLQDPIEINGDIARAETAERYNVQLELIFGADSCHNVDRIMRLPGTINWPDAKKLKKGRTPTLAKLTEFHPERSYTLSEFTPAQAVQSNEVGIGSGAAAKVKVSENVQRLSNVDELGKEVSDKVKMVIVQGGDPDEPNKHPSRSEWLFWVCCELVRAGIEDDKIYAVITDKEFGIAGSVLDKGANAHRYALRQIERARDYAIDPELLALNERHAVISDMSGKCRVISEVWDPAMRRPRISRQTFEDFRNRYMNKFVEVGQDKNGSPILIPLGKWWLGNERRRQYETIVFSPRVEVPEAYNLWRGFACEARPGECGLYLQHIKRNICCGNETHYNYLIRWMANAVQNPDSQGHVAIVLRGKRGTGKGFFVSTFGSLFGRHYLAVSDPKHLVGNFNAHLRDTIVLFGDEAFYAGDKKHESVLKTLITEETIVVEPKGVDAEACPNYTHVILASNEDWVVPVGFDERRFLVLDVSSDHRQDFSYFRKIDELMNAGGREALLHYLMTMDLSGFNVRSAPDSEALRQQKLLSMGPEQEWWYEKLQSGVLLLEESEWGEPVLRERLLGDFIGRARLLNISKRGSATKLGRFLNKACPAGWPKETQNGTPAEVRQPDGSYVQIARPYYLEFPSLEECRTHWDQEFGGPYNWKEIAQSNGHKPGEGVPF